MPPGQKCLVRCESRFAYGADGCPATEPEDTDLPPSSDIELLVELLEVLSTTALSDMTPEEATKEGQRKKRAGNGHFARAAYKKALRSYTSASNAVAEIDFPDTDTESYREARQLRVDCGNNIATTLVHLGEMDKAKEAAVGVLELDPVNAKALYRAGKISSLQSDFVEAKLALGKALDLNPESKEVQAELRRLSARMKAYQTKKRSMQETMGRNLFARVEPERVGSSRKHDDEVVKADVGRDVSASAHAEREVEVLPTGSEDVSVNSSQSLGREARTKTYLSERCGLIPIYVVVALAAWGAMYAVAR